MAFWASRLNFLNEVFKIMPNCCCNLNGLQKKNCFYVLCSTQPRDKGLFQLQSDSRVQHFWKHPSLWVQYKWYNLGCRNHTCLLCNQSKSYYYTKILLLLLVKGWHFIIVFIKIYIILKNNLTTLILFYLCNNSLTVKGILSMLF